MSEERVVLVPSHQLFDCGFGREERDITPEWSLEVSVSNEGFIKASYNVQRGPDFCLEWEVE